MFEISKEFNFSAAHRLEGHPKCGRMHGHNYRVVVTLRGNELVNSWLMDFGDLKKIVSPFIDEMDHRYLVSVENKERDCPYLQAAPKEDLYFLSTGRSTAECIAEELASQLFYMKPWNINEVEVTIWETPSSQATCTKKASTA